RRMSLVAACCSCASTRSWSRIWSCASASARRSSRSRTLASSLIGDFGGAGRLDATSPSRASWLDVYALLTAQACEIVVGGDDRLCERARRGKVGGGVGSAWLSPCFALPGLRFFLSLRLAPSMSRRVSTSSEIHGTMVGGSASDFGRHRV